MNFEISPNISLHVTCGAPEAADIVVTLPTFRRPEHVRLTLQSLAAQNCAQSVAVIVMDNDADNPVGADAAAIAMREFGMDGLVLIAHERGNCSAYNAGWSTALAKLPHWSFLCVIDDDELATPEWIAAHLATLGKTGADICGGPQRPVFDGGENSPHRNHPVFRPPYCASGPVDALYSSGNLAIRRRVLESMPQPFLDTRFNFLGGGDSDFLSRASQKGFVLAWSEEAVINETIPARRLEWDWINARAIRNGVISTLVERRKRYDEPFGRLRIGLKSALLLLASPVRGLATALRERSLASGLYPAQVALGRIMAEFGYMNEQYRNADKN
jgi:glycosyltransferase involved in cell wall biosynthesis